MSHDPSHLMTRSINLIFIGPCLWFPECFTTDIGIEFVCVTFLLDFGRFCGFLEILRLPCWLADTIITLPLTWMTQPAILKPGSKQTWKDDLQTNPRLGRTNDARLAGWKVTCMKRPNLDELSFLMVFALPNASRMVLASRICCCTHVEMFAVTLGGSWKCESVKEDFCFSSNAISQSVILLLKIKRFSSHLPSISKGQCGWKNCGGQERREEA